MTSKVSLAVTFVLIAMVTVSGQSPASRSAAPGWIARSNENALLLLRTSARFDPEAASDLGFEQADDQVVDWNPGFRQRRRAAVAEVERELKQRLAQEKDPMVAQDLQILLKAAALDIKGSELQEKYEIPYHNVAEQVFSGLHSLLDEQVSPERRQMAVLRLRRYAGLEDGYKPLTRLAMEDTQSAFGRPGLQGPIRIQVETNLAQSQFFLDGMQQLFQTYKLTGYEDALKTLREQIGGYNEFVRSEVLPKSRADFRQVPQLYDFDLEMYGVDIPKEKLVMEAHAAFNQIKGEMEQLAPAVAGQKGIPQTDYLSVIRELKKKQITGDDVLPFYRQRLSDIERIIRREHLVTLPDRPARIRLATSAESAQTPAPHMQPPPLVNNHGEEGVFVLPLNLPPSSASQKMDEKLDDFTHDAAGWTLTAHEARPGHELQFDAMVEQGVSLARAVFASNSTNVEGWGLYSEYLIFPYMPPDGQMVSLQYRLQRAARAFIDPELQMGKLSPEQARHILTDEVGLSQPFANSEIERYTFRMPGQANSYFYGYTRLLSLRSEVEKGLGAGFSQQKFHDFIISQGLLPPDQLRQAVFREFGVRSKGQD